MFEHFSDFALYGRWEGLNRPERLDLSSLRDPRIEFSILRTFIFLIFWTSQTPIFKNELSTMRAKYSERKVTSAVQKLIMTFNVPPHRGDSDSVLASHGPIIRDCMSLK